MELVMKPQTGHLLWHKRGVGNTKIISEETADGWNHQTITKISVGFALAVPFEIGSAPSKDLESRMKMALGRKMAQLVLQCQNQETQTWEIVSLHIEWNSDKQSGLAIFKMVTSCALYHRLENKSSHVNDLI
jgi:hypothetical protein